MSGHTQETKDDATMTMYKWNKAWHMVNIKHVSCLNYLCWWVEKQSLPCSRTCVESPGLYSALVLSTFPMSAETIPIQSGHGLIIAALLGWQITVQCLSEESSILGGALNPAKRGLNLEQWFSKLSSGTPWPACLRFVSLLQHTWFPEDQGWEPLI